MATKVSNYNSKEFDFRPTSPPKTSETLPAQVGMPAPDFTLAAVDGGEVSLSDLRGSYVVMMSGAVTSPMCAFEVPNLNQLQKEFGPKGFKFFLLYGREPHAGENYPVPESNEQKMSNAQDLKRLENVEFPILVDGIDGATHQSYGPWPASLFVIDKEGKLLYRANMSNSPELRQFLEDVVKADEFREAGEMLHYEYSERLVPHLAQIAVHSRIFERAGQGAQAGTWPPTGKSKI